MMSNLSQLCNIEHSLSANNKNDVVVSNHYKLITFELFINTDSPMEETLFSIWRGLLDPVHITKQECVSHLMKKILKRVEKK